MTTTTQNPLSVIVAKEGLTEAKSQAIIQTFGPLVEEAGQVVPLATAITIIGDPSDGEIAHCAALRKQLKSIRTRTENARVELKADALKTGKAIDASSNWIKARIEPAEARMLEIEQFAARQEAERIETLRVVRTNALMQYGVDHPLMGNLGETEEDQFQKVLRGVKLEHEDRQRREAEAETARKAEETRKAEELEKLKQQRAESDARFEAERRKREETEAAARKEREAAETRARQEKAKADAKLREEREAREKLEQEKRDREAAEKKRLADEAKAAKKAAAAPDAQKLRALADALGMLPVPVVKSAEARKAVETSNTAIAELQNFLTNAADSL